ncbi:MAG: gephyrin-like molybdotransferase Glp [Bacteroidia bacterium]
MISVTEAIKMLQNQELNLPFVTLNVVEASQYVLAEEIFSPIDMPTFAQSAMDGYAIHFDSWKKGAPLPIVGMIVAGETATFTLKAGEAMRIFTGAPVPEGADTVVMQEKVKVIDNQLYIEDEKLVKAANVRPKASQTAKNNLVVPKNTLLTAGRIGLLASLGIEKVKLYAKPRVSLLITGKELIAAGNPLQHGQVYESNSATLKAALAEMGIEISQKHLVSDELAATVTEIQHLLTQTDILLITGGISVGDYDYVKTALEQIGVTQLFYKVAQKPGKPIYVGKLENKIIFALPGNPASVHTCFYRYVKPFLLQTMGHFSPFEPTYYPTLTHDFEKNNALTLLLKAKLSPNGTVEILSHQESYKMNSYVEANGFVVIAAEKNVYGVGEKVAFFGY